VVVAQEIAKPISDIEFPISRERDVLELAGEVMQEQH
jgi:hypothetical protein